MKCKHKGCNKNTPHQRCLEHRIAYNLRYGGRYKHITAAQRRLEEQLARCADDCARRLILGVSEQYDDLERAA